MGGEPIFALVSPASRESYMCLVGTVSIQPSGRVAEAFTDVIARAAGDLLADKGRLAEFATRTQAQLFRQKGSIRSALGIP